MQKSKPLILCFLANPLGWKNPGLFGGGEKITKDMLESLTDFGFIIIQGNGDIVRNESRFIKKIVELPFKKTKSTFGDIINFFFWLLLSVKEGLAYKNDINLIYSPTSNISDFLPSFIIGKMLKKKIIVKVHITIYHGKSSGFINVYRNLRREDNTLFNSIVRTISTQFVFMLLNKTDLIIVVSQAIAEDLRLLGINTDITVNRNGIAINNNSGYSGQRDYDICFISRIERYKGIYEFIKICKQLKNSKGIIIGGGKESDKILQILKEDSDLVQRIKYLGFLKEQRFDYLKKSKIFLFPTKASEGQAIVIAESMSMGVVTITYKNDLFNQLYGLNKSVILVNNIEEMYLKAKYLLSNKKELAQLSAIAVIEAKDFDIKKSIIREKKLIWSKIKA